MYALSLFSMLIGLARHHAGQARREDGSISVEQVLITAGLVVAALAVVAVIKRAVDTYGAGVIGGP